MIIPINTNNFDQKRFPSVCVVLIAINIFFYLILQDLGDNDSFTFGYSLVPQEILTGHDVVEPLRDITLRNGVTVHVQGPEETSIPVHLTLLTSMFMHGGFLHLFFNMLFLYVFGSSIENKLGHKTFFGFYLGCGVLAVLAHVLVVVFTGKDLLRPVLGASGAISGVMGAFLILCPHQKVKTMIVLIIRNPTFYLPAWVYLGGWIFWQLIDGISSLSSPTSGGVAYAAHIGGFFAGLLYAKFIFTGDEEGEHEETPEAPPGVSASPFGALPKKEYVPVSAPKRARSRSDAAVERALCLRCEQGLRVGERYALKSTRTLIGRSDPSTTVDIDLTAQEDDLTPRSVSRQHVEIERSGDEYLVRDKGSFNGSELNGVKLTPGRSSPLKLGDRLEIGAITLIVEVDESA